MTALALALLLASDPAAAAAPASSLEVVPVPGRANLLRLGIPEIPPELSARLAQYQNARAAVLQDVSDDGRTLLVTTRFGNTAQLHVVTAPLGMREQITFGEEPVSSARFAPGDPRTVYYLQDRGGGEAYQLHRLDRRTGRAELLTDGKSRHEALLVSRDGRRLAYAGTGRNGKDTDVYVADPALPREARRAVEGAGTFFPVDFSPDGTRLLVTQFRSIADADLFVVDLASGARTPLLDGEGSLRDAAFAADGRSVYAVTDRGGEWNVLVRIDLARPGVGAAPVATTPRIAWDVEQVAVARDGTVALSVNEDGSSRFRVLDPRTGRLTSIPGLAGVAGRIVFPRGRSDLLAIGVGTPTSPFDAFVADFQTGKVTRWTRSEVGGLDPGTFVEPQLVRYPTSGGAKVPAFLYRPRGAGRWPVVVQWHGGPEGQHRPGFSPTVQFLVVELGFAVLQPNVRGSDGYGKAWLAMDDGVKREEALRDIPATFDFVASRPDLDPARVAVTGGSYGGYMTLATVALFPGRARAAASTVGISSLATFLESTQPYRRELRRAEYGDERIPEIRAVQERISPLTHAARIDAPLLVVQGKNDPRVPQGESEQIVKAVRANGKEVWYLLALDEGHGFQKKVNRDYATEVSMAFLQRMLGDPAAW
jgi:dipeptidyl aminopeptidase/acylaminoacyl peptidase